MALASQSLITVPYGAGIIDTIPRLLGASSLLAIATSDANLSLNTTTGAVTAAKAIGYNTTQSMIVTEKLGTTTKIRPFGFYVAPIPPSAPIISLNHVSHQTVVLNWIDGDAKGMPIAARLIDMGTTTGGEGTMQPVTVTNGLATITGLTDLQPYFFEGVIQTDAGTSTLSNEVQATPVAAPFNNIHANGWQVDYPASNPPISFQPMTSFQVQRAGYDTTGSPTTYTQSMVITQRVRLPYSSTNQTLPLLLTPLTCALSDVLVTSDVVPGATNTSTMVMPKPIVNWSMHARKLVGNTLTLEVTGNHWAARNGLPFAAVIFSVTDGVNTVTATARAMTVSGHSGDKAAVQVYQATIDITSLNTGLITANAQVFPWIGGSASVANSATDSTVPREFSPRYFYKNVALLTTPPLAYVSSTGSDTTGVVSTTAATASATPFLTVQGAINGLIAATAVTGGYVDGCRIRVKAGTVSMGASATVARAQKCAALVVEADPATATAATAIVTQSASWRARLGVGTLIGGLTEGAIAFSNITVQRTANVAMWNGESANALNVMLSNNAILDLGSFTGTTLANSHLWLDGVTAVNAATGALNAGAYEIRMVRGLSISAGYGGIEGWLVLGCKLTSPGQMTFGTRTESGRIIQFNYVTDPQSTADWVYVGAAANASQVSVSCNLIEVLHTTTSTCSMRASGDSATGNLTHVLFDNNTVATGHYQAGRFNFCYDELQGTVRTHIFTRVKNSVIGAYYIKGDYFVGANGNGSPNITDAPNHIGNWAPEYGVNYLNLYTLFSNTGANLEGMQQGPIFKGFGSSLAQTMATPQFSLAAGVTWTNWQANNTNPSTGAIIAGAGGGDYTVPSGSPLIGTVNAVDEVFTYDLAGVLRTRGCVGAYA